MSGLGADRPPEIRGHRSTAENVLCGQSLPSFGSASIDDLAAVFGLHACPKSVRSLARSVVGLVGSFHALIPLDN